MRKFTKWSKSHASDSLCRIILEGVERDKYPRMTIGEAIERFHHVAPFPTKKNMLEAKSYLPMLLDIYNPHTPLGEAGSGALFNFLRGKSESTGHHLKAWTAKMIRYLYSGDLPVNKIERHPIAEQKSGTLLKFSTMHVSDIKKIMPCSEVGRDRFASVKMLMYRHLLEMPADQCGTISLPSDVKDNAKERMKLEKSLRKFLKSQLPDWGIRWNPVEGIFVVARTKDWGGDHGKETT
jgi:hypothetical protein